MIDMMLGYHARSWGSGGFIDALKDISDAGYSGVAVLNSVVEKYEDRAEVLREIMGDLKLSMAAIQGEGNFVDPEKLEEDVEFNMNFARFIKSFDADRMIIDAPFYDNNFRPKQDEESEEIIEYAPEELKEIQFNNMCSVIKNLSERSLEMGVRTCLRPVRGSMVSSRPDLEKVIDTIDGKKKNKTNILSICFDTSEFFLCDLDIEIALKEFHNRIGIVHFTDIKIQESKSKKNPITKYLPVPLGEGDLNIKLLVDILHEVDYKGWIIVDAYKSDFNKKDASKLSRVYTEKLGFI